MLIYLSYIANGEHPMKIAILVTRILLGLMFFVFGLNNILHFLPMPTMPPSDGVAFATLLMNHGYMSFVGVLMTIAGLLLLVGRYIPIALVILGPIIVNILMYHIFFHQPGIAAGLIATLLELFLISAYRLSFRGLFDAAPEVS